MAQQQTNPLLYPPFFLIPGISPNSPVSTQTEQIDQLNTLLLQEIDANFAKFHQVVTSRILPEIKRFAIAGEPTRGAAHFWKKFYEAAAGVRSTVEGESTVHEDTHSRSTYEDHSLAIPRDDEQSFSAPHDEGSFVFGHGATASTPLAKKQYTNTGNNSWEDSIESPFEKNDRRLRDMQIGGNAGHELDDTSDLPTPSLPAGYSIGDESSSTSPSIRPPGHDSNLYGHNRPLSSTPKASKSHAASSSHITDLRNTPLNAKFPKFIPKGKSPARSHFPAPLDYDDDDSDDDLYGGMSPPKTMSFGHLPPRVQAINAAAREKTPKKVHADAILHSVMSEMGETEGLYVPSPHYVPEFAKRYSLLPEEMGPAPVENLFAKLKAAEQPSAPSRNTQTRKSMANTSFGSDKVSGPSGGQVGGDDSLDQDQDDSFSSDGSGTVPPPGEYRSDVSYTTNTPGGTNRYGNVGDMSTTMHPTRGVGNDSEVFGAPAGVPSAQGAELHIMRPGEIYTYMGGQLEDAAGRELDETPLKGQGKRGR